MRCISPIQIKTNWYYDFGLKEMTNIRTVPCGQCFACLKRKRADWIFRLQTENATSTTNYFITLTYDDSLVPLVKDSDVPYMTLVKSDFTKWLKRLRHKIPKFKMYSIGEYGSQTLRPHYHLLLFTNDVDYDAISQAVFDTWKFGLYHIGQVEEQSISYVTKYVITKPSKDLQDYINMSGVAPPFMQCSKGIGIRYFEKNKNLHRSEDDFYVQSMDGKKHAMPRYYVDKFFQEDIKTKHRAVVADMDIKEINQKDLPFLIDKFNKQLIKTNKLTL